MAQDPRKPKNATKQQRETRNADALPMPARWEDGPVTSTWVEMWKRIFRDLQADQVKNEPCSDEPQEQGR